jgi:hypothetical protein
MVDTVRAIVAAVGVVECSGRPARVVKRVMRRSQGEMDRWWRRKTRRGWGSAQTRTGTKGAGLQSCCALPSFTRRP